MDLDHLSFHLVLAIISTHNIGVLWWSSSGSASSSLIFFCVLSRPWFRHQRYPQCTNESSNEVRICGFRAVWSHGWDVSGVPLWVVGCGFAGRAKAWPYSHRKKVGSMRWDITW